MKSGDTKASGQEESRPPLVSLEEGIGSQTAPMDAEGSHSSSDDIPSSPEYLQFGEEELGDGDEVAAATAAEGVPDGRIAEHGRDAIYPSKDTSQSADAAVGNGDDPDEMYPIEDGEDYILGSLMVRILQGKHLRLNPNTRGIGGFLSKHRRSRHAKTSASPASGGNLTPSAHSQQVYARIEFKRQTALFPHRTISNTVRPVASSASMSTLSTKSSSSSANSRSSVTTVTSQPKTYRVEEVIGDHVVLSYETPERWLCTFEVHRYLLFTVERHQAVVEKAKEHVLDFVDNISQSPMIESLAHTIDKIPDEGLVYVSADVVEGGIGLAGKWWESGIQGAVEDIVDATNLDGRYCHYSISDEEEEEESLGDEDGESKVATYKNSEDDVAEPIPGMPNCPITGTPMIHPVVAADGHTYERSAIARWLETSDRSPLTGQRMAHFNLAPNYLLLSSFESHEL